MLTETNYFAILTYLLCQYFVLDHVEINIKRIYPFRSIYVLYKCIACLIY